VKTQRESHLSSHSKTNYSYDPGVSAGIVKTIPAVEWPTEQWILVTGGADYTGSHLIDALVASNEVRVLK